MKRPSLTLVSHIQSIYRLLDFSFITLLFFLPETTLLGQQQKYTRSCYKLPSFSCRLHIKLFISVFIFYLSNDSKVILNGHICLLDICGVGFNFIDLDRGYAGCSVRYFEYFWVFLMELSSC